MHCAPRDYTSERRYELSSMTEFFTPTRLATLYAKIGYNPVAPDPEPPPTRYLSESIANSDDTELTLVECVRNSPTRKDSYPSRSIGRNVYTVATNLNPLHSRVDTSRREDSPPKKSLHSPRLDSWSKVPYTPLSPHGKHEVYVEGYNKVLGWDDLTHTEGLDTPDKEARLFQLKYGSRNSRLISMHHSPNVPSSSKGKEPMSSSEKVPVRETSDTGSSITGLEQLQRKHLHASIIESMRRESGPGLASDTRTINQYLPILVYGVDTESDEFIKTITRVSRPGNSPLYKPSTDFCLALLQCGTIVQDSAAEIARYHGVPVSEPYVFDPGDSFAVHMEAGLSSENQVAQLVALALRRLRTGIRIISQVQQSSDATSIAYTTNSRVQTDVRNVIARAPDSPSAKYTTAQAELNWRGAEMPTPQTRLSSEGTQIPRPRFNVNRPRPSVDPVRAQELAPHVTPREPRASGIESHYGHVYIDS